MKKLLVGTVQQKKISEEVIRRNSPTQKGRNFRLEQSHKKVVKMLLVRTVPPKNSEEAIGKNSPTKKISEEVINKNMPTKK